MRRLMQAVVQEGGTGRLAASALYPTAGKTGTAQKVSAGSRGYTKGKYFASFVGFAPADKPRIVVFVGIDEDDVYFFESADGADIDTDPDFFNALEIEGFD